MASGSMRDRVEFFRLNATADEYGNETSGFAEAAFLSRACEFMPEMGRERMEAGRPESSGMAKIRVIRDSETAAVTTADKAVIRGEDYQVRYIEPHSHGRDRYMLLERGVAVGSVVASTEAGAFSSAFSAAFA